VTPLLLGYGNVVMGDTSVLGVTIQNSGAADLSVTSIAFGRGSSADFAISIDKIFIKSKRVGHLLDYFCYPQ
jgi:hypothetical protein